MSDERTDQEAKEEARASEARREIWLSIGAFFLYLILGFALMMWLNARREATMIPTAPVAQKPIALTILHTNDTWGYLEPCG